MLERCTRHAGEVYPACWRSTYPPWLQEVHTHHGCRTDTHHGCRTDIYHGAWVYTTHHGAWVYTTHHGIPVLYHPGYTRTIPTIPVQRVPVTAVEQCAAKSTWAQEERNPWVESLLASLSLNSVTVGMPFCAWLLRSS